MDSMMFHLSFHPTAFGVYRGRVLFANDAELSSSVLKISGTYAPERIELSMDAGWNLVSLPMVVGDPRTGTVFPGSSSQAFCYGGLYYPTDTLRVGAGYWLKYPSPESVKIPGTVIQSDTIPVKKCWNMIGSFTFSVAVGMIGSIPPGIRTSGFYAYDGGPGYVLTDTIRPGSGYWVRASQAGRLILSSSANIPAKNRIRIIASSELPPPPPGEEIANLKSQIPARYALEQNYPNPFNPKTDFRLQIADYGFVSLKIFDVLGREVATLVDKPLEPGMYTVGWDADGFPSGVYFYRMQVYGSDESKTRKAGSYVETKKLMLLK
jgi:hypothetical protein